MVVVENGQLEKCDEILVDNTLLRWMSLNSAEATLPATAGETRFKCRDITNVKEGDGCRECSATLAQTKGIEVGHVFYLGTKYAKPLDCMFEDEAQQRQYVEMGCYGLGVGRIVAAALEHLGDSHGLRWPNAIAPYLVCIAAGSDAGTDTAKQLAGDLVARLPRLNNDVLVDDRPRKKVGLGSALMEAQVLGYPFVIVLGKEFERTGKLELQVRSTGEKQLLTRDELHAFFHNLRI